MELGMIGPGKMAGEIKGLLVRGGHAMEKA